MEGVGARLGRTSTRYGPATVFTGPVRKWKKKWVHVAPSTKDNNNHNHNHNHSHQIHNHGGATATATAANGTSTNGNNGSHLLLYKWTPITQSQNTNNNNNNSSNNNSSSNNNNSNTNVNGGDKSDVAAAPEEPPRRKIRYIPIAVLEEQKNEDAENEDAEKVDDDDDEEDDDDDKQIDIDPNASESTAKVEVLDEKPDINDVPMEENQENNQLIRQDLNERTLDLSLGLKAHDDDHDPDSKTD